MPLPVACAEGNIQLQGELQHQELEPCYHLPRGHVLAPGHGWNEAQQLHSTSPKGSIVRRSFSDYYKSTRLFRYRVRSVFSKRDAHRYRILKEISDWCKDGYNYEAIYRRACIIRATGAIYLPVAKSANTAIKHMIAAESPSDEHKIHYGTPRGLARLRDHRMTLNELATGSWRSFTVVRHPIDRFASAYRDGILLGRIHSFKRMVWTFLDREEGASISIDDLIAYLAETPPEEVNGHVRPQWSACGAGRIPFELVGKVERLEHDVNAFAEVGLISGESVGRLAVRNATGGNANRELSRRQKATLTRLYERDFDTFDY